MWTANGDLCAEVTDDGRGFDPARLAPGVHHGITGMGERAELLGGQLEIDSQSGVATTAGLHSRAIELGADAVLDKMTHLGHIAHTVRRLLAGERLVLSEDDLR